MSDCNWRYLTADGRTDPCVLDHVGPDRIDGDKFALYDHASSHVGWEEDDPCAWDATCPDCDGHGCPYCDGPDADYHTSCVDCPSCGGAGTVDTIPPHLIGPGSKLEQPDGSWAYVLDNYGPANVVIWDDATRSGYRVNVSARIIDRDAIGTIYEVTRAVPPAGDTT